MKDIKYYPKGRLRAKLSFDDGFAENPLYVIKGNTNEKWKGINMIELISANFDINSKEFKDAMDKKLREWDRDPRKPTKLKGIEPLKLNRDERGNLVSPFRSEKKLI